MATLAEHQQQIEHRLKEAGNVDTPRLEARLLLEMVTGLTHLGIFNAPHRLLSDEEIKHLEQAVARRIQHEPMSHILGMREFWGLPFKVSSAVLTPRPDSETLIETVLTYFPDQKAALRVLDLGTGSGCLLLAALSEYPLATGLGVDCSSAALEVAVSNAQSLGLAARAAFVCSNWDDGVEGHFDIILSNPPYIRLDEAADLEPDVRDYEPALALYAGADGLDAYRALAQRLPTRLSPQGVAFIELGAGQGPAVGALFEAAGMKVPESVPDLAGIERCLVVRHHVGS